jgi:hypothetical protein
MRAIQMHTFKVGAHFDHALQVRALKMCALKIHAQFFAL